MHNNLKIIIRIFSTIYLSLSVLFTSVPLYWYHESWVQKPRNFGHDTAKIGSASNFHLSMTIRPLKMVLEFINF